MSRIGKLPIIVPKNVQANINQNLVTIKGPKGEIVNNFNPVVSIILKECKIIVIPNKKTKFARSMHGTARSIINNMIIGVTKGYSKNLIIEGVGFRAVVQNNFLDLNLGYSHPVKYPIPKDIIITVANNTKLQIEGIDKSLVGKVASDIHHYCPAEPYKGKGVRILGKFFRRKEGKKTG